MKEIITQLNNILKEDVIVIGCSGGPDSMCLLHLLKTNFNNLKIICAHLDHNLRETSATESDFVKDYCINNDIIFEGQKLIKAKNNSEVELRRKRYLFFQEVITKYKAQYLFTAHHGDDLIETILMKIIRGSNLKGYMGFKFMTRQDTYVAVKPLISKTKAEILQYLKANKVPFIIDSSNDDLNYTRNRYRHKIIPLLKKEDKNLLQKFNQFASELDQYYQHINQEVIRKTKFIKQGDYYLINKFMGFDELIQKKIIENIFFEIYKDQLELVNQKHVSLVLKMINNQQSNSLVKLPNKVIITKEYGLLKTSVAQQPGEEYNYELKKQVILPNNKKIEIVNSSASSSNNCTRLLSSELKFPLRVRTRKNGDKFIMKNSVGHKKINDVFIEKKITHSERDSWPILVDAKDNILWLPGLKKTNYDKAKTKKYDIIIEYI